MDKITQNHCETEWWFNYRMGMILCFWQRPPSSYRRTHESIYAQVYIKQQFFSAIGIIFNILKCTVYPAE